MSLGAGRGGCAESPLHCPHQGGLGVLGPSLACLLAHHSQLVAQGRTRKAALITIVTRADSCQDLSPWLRGKVGLCPPRSKEWPQGHPCVLPSCSLWQQPPLAHPLLPSCWLLSVPFPSLPQSTGLGLQGPTSCTEEPHRPRGPGWGFWGRNCLFSCMWGLWCLHSLTREGGTYRVVSAWVIVFSCWR